MRRVCGFASGRAKADILSVASIGFNRRAGSRLDAFVHRA